MKKFHEKRLGSVADFQSLTRDLNYLHFFVKLVCPTDVDVENNA
jgi:hypothetical protein